MSKRGVAEEGEEEVDIERERDEREEVKRRRERRGRGGKIIVRERGLRETDGRERGKS